jgi:2-polyprenyl-6-hydroxyphenyl methylase/3-demethylubiquinone-9 3-methyltransferase
MKYYSKKLAGERLRRCYELAPQPIKRYLSAEIDFVRERVQPSFSILELGCGYGRALKPLAPFAETVVGIDTSLDSLRLASRILEGDLNCHLIAMDAVKIGFRTGRFDLVFCIQNGISAFHVDGRALIQAAIEVTKPGGKVLFSSYSDRFWEPRLEWFRIQSAEGLIGPIDEEATGGGAIVCKDGFRAETISGREFTVLTEGLGTRVVITEVAESSLFCEIIV